MKEKQQLFSVLANFSPNSVKVEITTFTLINVCISIISFPLVNVKLIYAPLVLPVNLGNAILEGDRQEHVACMVYGMSGINEFVLAIHHLGFCTNGLLRLGLVVDVGVLLGLERATGEVGIRRMWFPTVGKDYPQVAVGDTDNTGYL